MTRYVLKTEVVRDCLHRLIDEPIHRMFPGYLCLQQQAAQENRTSGLSFPYNEFFDDYLRIREDSDRPYFVPFTQAESPSLGELWNNKNVAGTYAPSSLRSTAPLMKIADIEEGGHNSKWAIEERHWELARHNLCGGDQVPVESLAAYLLRDCAFEAEEPSAYTLVETFNKEFGYEFGDEEFSHLYRSSDSEIGETSFVELEDIDNSTQSKLGIDNAKRTAEKVRRVSPEQLEIPSAPGEEAQDDEKRWEALRTAAVDASDGSGFGAAIRTSEGSIVTARSLSRGVSHDVHALELAVWKGFESAQSSIAEVAVAEQSMDVPCGRCLQVLEDYAESEDVPVQVTDGDSVSKYTLADIFR